MYCSSVLDQNDHIHYYYIVTLTVLYVHRYSSINASISNTLTSANVRYFSTNAASCFFPMPCTAGNASCRFAMSECCTWNHSQYSAGGRAPLYFDLNKLCIVDIVILLREVRVEPLYQNIFPTPLWLHNKEHTPTSAYSCPIPVQSYSEELCPSV